MHRLKTSKKKHTTAGYEKKIFTKVKVIKKKLYFWLSYNMVVVRGTRISLAGQPGPYKNNYVQTCI